MAAYKQDYGEWFRFVLADGVHQQCCSCGHCHHVEVRRNGRGYEMRFTTLPRATAAARRRRKKKVVIIDD